ncbi:MAG: thioesterase family protein [Pseudomonadota bacterium]|nr:thioesterase family protein [Pseudomonadota bacterium]
MKRFRLPIKVMFCDCDPAQIVFYPKYFQWFDIATQTMFNKLDMEWSKFWQERGIAGLPLVDASATFIGPARMDDEIEIESWVEEWKEKIFVVRHNVIKNGQIIVEGKEVRACVAVDPESAKGIRAKPMPADVIAKFEESDT